MLVCEETDKNPFSLHTMWLKLINFIFASKQNKKQVQLSINLLPYFKRWTEQFLFILTL